jgi:tetratricopeptide (TPR) repeat protein
MYPNKRVDELRRAGNLDQALELGTDLLRESPDDNYLKGSVGWVLHDRIKADVQKARSEAGGLAQPQLTERLRSNLRAYAKLELGRPDLLFSRIVFWAFLAPGKHAFLVRFLIWAGLDAFQQEDYRSQTSNDGHTYEPLVEKVALQASKWARDEHDAELHEYLIEFIDRVLAHADVRGPHWLQYNKALLLQRLGRTNEAEDLLIPFVREKRNEFWAWHALGKVREQSGSETCLSIYAKACLCCTDPRYGVRVYEDLAKAALARNQLGMARWAIDCAVNTRNSEGWSFPPVLRDMIEADWYGKAPILPNPKEALEEFAEASSEEIYADCPWVSGNYLGTFEAKSGKLHDRIAIRHREECTEIVWPIRDQSLSEDLEFGEPIIAKVFEDQGRLSMIEVRSRDEGESFDCLDRTIGVIDHQNTDKGLASVYLTESQFALLQYQDYDWVASLAPGSAVEIRYTTRGERISAHQAEPASFRESPCIRRISGHISINRQGFGFVEDVFVPPHLAQEFEHADEVSLVAVRKTNRKTNQLGWTALGNWVTAA